MDYEFENLVDSKTKEPLVLEDVSEEMLEVMKVAREKGTEAAKRCSKFFSGDY